MNFIQSLTGMICTQGGMDKAREYLISRGINPDLMRYSFSATGGNEAPFKIFSNLYPANIFVDSLYMPVLDIQEPTHIIGFDVRYLGDASFRTRFHKFKVSPDSLMMYCSKNIQDIVNDEPIIVVESIIDALTIEQLGYTVISPLTSLHNIKFCLFLHSISDKIYFMYDNDDTGRKALQKIMKNVSLDMDIQKCFRPIIYSGKDPNQVLMSLGSEYLENILKMQAGELR